MSELEPIDEDGYQRIFAGVCDKTALRKAIARAVRQLREAMEKEDNCAVTAAHVRNLAEIDPMALARAYAIAEKTCIYWPSPGQIRELAGWTQEGKSRSGLEWVFAYLLKHGCEGRSLGGGLHFGEDETGRRVLLEVQPVVAAPALPLEIERTLALLGGGAARHGLHYVSQHPIVKGWKEFAGDTAAKAAERIEARWTSCYLQVMRKQAQGTSRSQA